ncbi:MAG: hypothetical protein AAFS13_03320 [Pseudomonadota bacterium]
MTDVFAGQGVEDFSDLLLAASLAAIEEKPAAEITSQSDFIVATLRNAAAQAPQNGTSGTQIAAGVVADQIDRAINMYREASSTEQYEPYLDGYGFFKTAEALYEESEADISQTYPELSREIASAIALLVDAYPSAVRPDELNVDQRQLTVAGSNIALALPR